jgi:VWFA-related protein
MGMMMAAALLVLQGTAAQEAEVRSLTISVADDKGAPVEGLVRDEVAVIENGVARDVTLVEPDTRPLVVTVLVDTSEEAGSAYRLNVIDAVTSFLGRLPEGARFTIWTTGDRPTRILELTDDVAAASKALRRAPTTGGNTMLDALVEGTRDLKKLEGSRTAVVVVTGMTPNFASRDRFGATDEAAKNADLFLVADYEEGTADFEAKAAYNYVFDTLAKKSGGRFETAVSVMGLPQALQKLATELRGRYRVSYATLPEIKSRKIEVQVARPGAKVRVGTRAVDSSAKP